MPKKILIAGASGFIGQALIRELLETTDYELVALSRYPRNSDNTRVEWRQADLFSLKDTSNAMNGCDEAIYLVHSMLPSASLAQGKFYDYDLIMADNFRRAAEKTKLKHIVYLGGMIPKNIELSWHLKSRLEVEQTLKAGDISVTTLRAGLIVGPQGSSFVILQRLIERLPVMITPDWAQTRSQPIYVGDVMKVIGRALRDKSLQGKIYDLGGNIILSYQDLMAKASQVMHRRRTFLHLNIIPLSLSRLWVKLVSGVHKDLVYPLVLSLKYPMLEDSELRWPHREDIVTDLDAALKLSLDSAQKAKIVIKDKFHGYRPEKRDVRSIQRLVLPPGKRAEWVSREYFNWLPLFFSSIIQTEINQERCSFYFFHPSIKILILERSLERSAPDRQLLYVVGGLLAGVQKRGRLEFREVLQGQYVLAALHEFRPALPWFIYRWTQAIVHLIVMKGFEEHLKWIYLKDQK